MTDWHILLAGAVVFFGVRAYVWYRRLGHDFEMLRKLDEQ